MADEYKEYASWFGVAVAAFLGALGISRRKKRHHHAPGSAENGARLDFDKFVSMYRNDQAEFARRLGEIEVDVKSLLRAFEQTESKLLEVADLRERVKLVEMKLRRAEGC
jgi:hypothetical protein